MVFDCLSRFPILKALVSRVRSLRALGYFHLTHRTRQTSLSCPMSLWDVQWVKASAFRCLRHCCPQTFHEGQPITEVPLKQKGPFLW